MSYEKYGLRKRDQSLQISISNKKEKHRYQVRKQHLTNYFAERRKLFFGEKTTNNTESSFLQMNSNNFRSQIVEKNIFVNSPSRQRHLSKQIIQNNVIEQRNVNQFQIKQEFNQGLYGVEKMIPQCINKNLQNNQINFLNVAPNQHNGNMSAPIMNVYQNNLFNQYQAMHFEQQTPYLVYPQPTNIVYQDRQKFNYIDLSFSYQCRNQFIPLQYHQANNQNSNLNSNFVFLPTILQNQRILKSPQFANSYFQHKENNYLQSKAKLMFQDQICKRHKQNSEFQISCQMSNISNIYNECSPFNKRNIQPQISFKIKFEEKDTNNHRNKRNNMQSSNKKKPQNDSPTFNYTNLKIEKPQPQNPEFKQKKQFRCTRNLFKQESVRQNKSQSLQKKNKILDSFKKNNPVEQRQLNLMKNRDYQYKILKKYKKFIMFDKILGKGTFAFVYLGLNTQTSQKVAVKQISIKKVKDFFEVEILKQISHQNVITLYDYLVEEQDKKCYLILEFCAQNLRERIDRFKKERIQQRDQLQIKLKYSEQLIEGMNALNEKGYLHRDLKFQNIMIKDDVLKICDFGLCRKLNNKLQLESIRCGTPYTMAPQIYFHSKESKSKPTYTQKADIFSLAVILHQFLYSIHPFDYQEDNLKQLKIIGKIKREAMLKRFDTKLGFNVDWIQKIIEKGLKPVEQRLTWDELMKIYRNRDKNCKQKQVIKEKDEIRNKQIVFETKQVKDKDAGVDQIIKSRKQDEKIDKNENNVDPFCKQKMNNNEREIFEDKRQINKRQINKRQIIYPKFIKKQIIINDNKNKYIMKQNIKKKQNDIIQQSRKLFGKQMKQKKKFEQLQRQKSRQNIQQSNGIRNIKQIDNNKLRYYGIDCQQMNMKQNNNKKQQIYKKEQIYKQRNILKTYQNNKIIFNQLQPLRSKLQHKQITNNNLYNSNINLLKQAIFVSNNNIKKQTNNNDNQKNKQILNKDNNQDKNEINQKVQNELNQKISLKKLFIGLLFSSIIFLIIGRIFFNQQSIKIE